MSTSATRTGTRSGTASRTDGWVEILARMGYAAKGLVYLAVGVLTAWTAFQTGGGGGQASRGSREALTTLTAIADDPFGQVLLALIVLGMAGYVVWRLVQVFLDPEHEGTGAKGLAKRGALLVSALIYASLGVWAARALLSGGNGAGSGGGGGSSAESWSRELLSHSWGAWVLGAAGLVVAFYGVTEFVKAYRRMYERRLRTDLSGTQRRWAGRTARFGLYARGVIFLIIGGFLVYTAVTSNPDQARGLEGALATVGRQEQGKWLLVLVALGLAAYGLFQMVKAWFRRIGPIDGV